MSVLSPRFIARASKVVRRCALLCLVAGCSSAAEAPAAPPPLPEAPRAPSEPAAIPAEADEPSKPVEPTRHVERSREPSRPTQPAKDAEPTKAEAKPRKSKTTGAAYVPPPVLAPVPTPAPAPKPAAVAATAPAAPKPVKRTSIPRTEHVHVEIPSGLQADLDADSRMQPWVEKVVAIADGCHAKARSSTGTIEALVTMHENDRPDVDMRSLPGQFGGIVACATGSLMRIKMPLFTGREGTRYTVRIVFD